MSTNAADDPKPINPGEIITAAWLNSTRGPGTILGADGVQVSRAGNRLAIATTSTHKTPPVAAVPGTIASEDGGGEYTWTRVGSGEGPASGTATEATGATGIAVGTKVTLHRTMGGLWWFSDVAVASASSVVMLRRSGAQSIANASGAVSDAVIWQVHDWVKGPQGANLHSISTNPTRITAPSSGRFTLRGAFKFVPNTTGIRGVDYYIDTVNTGLESFDNAVVAAGSSSYVMVIVDLVVTSGQYLEVSPYQNSGGPLDLNPGTWLAAEFVPD